MWQEEEEAAQWGRYVILGIVSGGWGKLGKCGGVNNPVHYVRCHQVMSIYLVYRCIRYYYYIAESRSLFRGLLEFWDTRNQDIFAGTGCSKKK